MGKEKKFWDLYFEVSARGSTLQTEIFAGLSTFLSLAYILVLNPAILSKAGFNSDSVLFATAVASGLATILMGVWAKLPFALAPGLEMNGFVAFSAIGLMGLTVEQSLGAVFWSGLLCIIFTWLPIRTKIINSMPLGLQSNLALSVGIFVVTIGLFISKIVIFEGGFPKHFGSLGSSEALALLIGLAVTIILRAVSNKETFSGRLVSGSSFLTAIVVSTVFCWNRGISPEAPPKVSLDMIARIGKLDWAPFTSPAFFTVFIVLFLIDFYGSIGKFIGLTAGTSLRSSGSGLVGIEKAMYVDGIGTVGGALLGTTSIITYVESAIGIHAGGRTGIVSIVCGILMILSLFFTPLISLVPVVATSGILIFVGYALLPREEWRSGEFKSFDLIIGILMGVVSFATFSLDKAMLIGFGAYSFKQVFSRTEKVNPYLICSFMLLCISVFVQFWFKG